MNGIINLRTLERKPGTKNMNKKDPRTKKKKKRKERKKKKDSDLAAESHSSWPSMIAIVSITVVRTRKTYTRKHTHTDARTQTHTHVRTDTCKRVFSWERGHSVDWILRLIKNIKWWIESISKHFRTARDSNIPDFCFVQVQLSLSRGRSWSILTFILERKREGERGREIMRKC